MPQIRQYEQPALGLQPTEVGVEATGRAARGIANNYDKAASAMSQVASETKQLGSQTAQAGVDFVQNIQSTIKQAEQFIEHQEISHGAKKYAELNDSLTQQWDKTAKNSDPNDPTVAAKFREEVLEPALNEYSKGFLTSGGEKFAQGRIDSIRNHMFEKTSADMSSKAADAISVDVKQTANSFSNTAINDPSAVPHLLDSVDAVVGGIIDSSPNIKGAAASKARMQLTEKMKESIVKSGAIGAIQKAANPEAEAEKWGQKYPQYISGDELKMLSANARQQTRARQIDESYIDRQQEKEQQRVSDTRETQYLQKLYSDDPQQQGQVSTKAIVNDPMLSRQSKERMIGVVNRELKPETASQASNSNAVDLLARLRLPEGDGERISDLNPIYQARIDGRLSRTDFEWLKKEFNDLRTPEGERLSTRKSEFIKAVSPSIDNSNPLMGKIDKDGKLNSYRLLTDLDKKIDEYRKAGKNPYDLMDPSKPDYMGTPASLQPYQKSIQDSTRDIVRRLVTGSKNLTAPGTTITGIEVTNAPAPKIEPRKPNESPAEYLKRTGSR